MLPLRLIEKKRQSQENKQGQRINGDQRVPHEAFRFLHDLFFLDGFADEKVEIKEKQRREIDEVAELKGKDKVKETYEENDSAGDHSQKQ